MAGKRREGRILAAQFLYMREVGVEGVSLDQALKDLWEQTEAEKPAQEFAEKRIRSVIEKQSEVDAELRKLVTNWDPERMAPVDRAILRLALWEMKFADDVPPISALNEAIEVAKALSTEESGRFVNGVLDRARATLGRPEREITRSTL
ncbi:MAG: transcription antitermination factor NusB [Verrucomicrobia bacterium]|nr:transcription antitermination factor NusB [Verrucomicrobiota bacterium]NBS84640.1 transcription antitermination factor NusB [Verrucomicrobiota bacterium]